MRILNIFVRCPPNDRDKEDTKISVKGTAKKAKKNINNVYITKLNENVYLAR